MGLLNIGGGKGPQIIQLFGRGVRLKGKDFSLKREVTSNIRLKKLQTLNIFGFNAAYINTFLDAIKLKVTLSNDTDNRSASSIRRFRLSSI